jgi:hypothetical protein
VTFSSPYAKHLVRHLLTDASILNICGKSELVVFGGCLICAFSFLKITILQTILKTGKNLKIDPDLILNN